MNVKQKAIHAEQGHTVKTKKGLMNVFHVIQRVNQRKDVLVKAQLNV